MNISTEANQILQEIKNTIHPIGVFVQKNKLIEFDTIITLMEKRIQFYQQYPPTIHSIQQLISLYLSLLHNPTIATLIVSSVHRLIVLLSRSKSNQLFLQRFLLCLLPISFNGKPQLVQTIVHSINDIPLTQILPSITPLLKSDSTAADCFVDIVLTSISKANNTNDVFIIENSIKQLLFYLTPSTKKRASNELRIVTFKIFQEIIVQQYSVSNLDSIKELLFFDLPSTLFKYLLYPVIFKDTFSQQSIILLTKLFSLKIKELKTQFECYWTYLLNTLDFLIHESDEVYKFIPNIESTCEIIFNSLLTISSIPNFALLLFNNYDCDIYSCNLFQNFLQTLHTTESMKQTPKNIKIQQFLIQLYFHILKSLHLQNDQIITLNSKDLNQNFQFKQKVLTILKDDLTIPEYFTKYSKLITENESIASMIYKIPLIDRSKTTKYLLDPNNQREFSIFLLLCFNADVLDSFFEVLRRISIPEDISLRRRLIEQCSLLFANKQGETEEGVLEEYKEMFGVTLQLYQKYWNEKLFTSIETLKRYAKDICNGIIDDNIIQAIVEGVFKNCPYYISINPPIKPMRHIKKYLFTKEKFCEEWNEESEATVLLETIGEWIQMNSGQWHNWDLNIIQNLTEGNLLLAKYAKENKNQKIVQLLIDWEIKESEVITQPDNLSNSLKNQKAIIRFSDIVVNNVEIIGDWKNISSVCVFLINNNIISPKDSMKNSKGMFSSVFKRRGTLKRKIKSVDKNKCVEKLMSVLPLQLNGEQINAFCMALFNNIVEIKSDSIFYAHHILIQHIISSNMNRLEIFWEGFLLLILSFCLKENGIENGKIMLAYILSIMPYFFENYVSKHNLLSSFILFIASLDQKHFEIIKDKMKVLFELLMTFISSINQQSVPPFIQMCLKKFPESFIILTRPFLSMTDQNTLQVIIKDMKNIYVVIGTLDYFEFSVIVMRRIFSFAPFPFHPAVPLFQYLCKVVELQFDCVLSKKEGPEIFKQFFSSFQMVFKYYSSHIPSSFYLAMVDIAYKKSIEFNVDPLHKMYLLTFIVRFFIDNFKRIDSIHNTSTIPDFISLIIQMTDIDDETSRKNSILMLNAFFTMLKRFYPERKDLLKQIEELKETLPNQIKKDLDLVSIHENFSPNTFMIDDDMYASTPRSSLDLNRNDLKK